AAVFPATDQRGLPRLAGGKVDVGAFESQPLVVNTPADGAATALGQVSLRQAVALANARTGADTINFSPLVFSSPQTIALAGPLELADLSATTTIHGLGADLLTIDGHQAGAFIVDAGVRATLDGLTIANGKSSVGGAIRNAGTLTLSNSTLAG